MQVVYFRPYHHHNDAIGGERGKIQPATFKLLVSRMLQVMLVHSIIYHTLHIAFVVPNRHLAGKYFRHRFSPCNPWPLGQRRRHGRRSQIWTIYCVKDTIYFFSRSHPLLMLFH